MLHPFPASAASTLPAFFVSQQTFGIVNLGRPVRHKLFSSGRLVFQQVRRLVEQVTDRLFGAFLAQHVPLFVNVVIHRVKRGESLRFGVGYVFGGRDSE